MTQLEEDEMLNDIPSKVGESIMKIIKFYKELHDIMEQAKQKQQQEQAQQQKEQAKEQQRLRERQEDRADRMAAMNQQKQLQLEQQEFTRKQNEAMMKAFKEAGIPPTDQNIKTAQQQAARLDDLQKQDKDLSSKMDALDKDIGRLKRSPITSLDDVEKNTDKIKDLEKQKSELQKQRKDIQAEITDIQKGQKLEGVGQSVGGPQVTPPSPTGIKTQQELTDSLDKLKKQEQDLSAQAEKLDKQVRQLKRSPITSLDDAEKLSDQIKELEKQREQLDEQLSKVEGQIQDLHEQAGELGLDPDGLAQEREKLDDLQQQTDDIDPEIVAKHKEEEREVHEHSLTDDESPTIDSTKPKIEEMSEDEAQKIETRDRSMTQDDFGGNRQRAMSMDDTQMNRGRTQGMDGSSPTRKRAMTMGGPQVEPEGNEQMVSIGGHSRPMSQVGKKSTLMALVNDGSAKVGTQSELSEALKQGIKKGPKVSK